MQSAPSLTMKFAIHLTAIIAITGVSSSSASAQPAAAAKPARPVAAANPAPANPNSAAEFLVPPGGGAFDVPIHAGTVCILSFPEEVVASAVVSSPALEVNAWGKDGVAVRVNNKATTATLALSTSSGRTKVNVTFRVVALKEAALTLVRFKAASVEEAFHAKVAAEVAKQVAPVLAEVAKTKATLAELIRERTDAAITERMVRRNQTTDLAAHERSEDHVIRHVKRSAVLGEDGYLFFEIENRSRVAYRLASVAVVGNGKNPVGLVRLASTAAADKDPAVFGVVAPGTTARGAFMVRDVAQVARKPVAFEISELQGRRKVSVQLGVAFK
jgi:hypothetical protein